MEKEVIFQRIQALQEQKRRAILYDNYRLEIDCDLSIVELYNILVRVDPENSEKYIRTVEEQTKIVKDKMKEHNYYGQSTRINEINDKIANRGTIVMNLTRKDLK